MDESRRCDGIRVQGKGTLRTCATSLPLLSTDRRIVRERTGERTGLSKQLVKGYHGARRTDKRRLEELEWEKE